eukprot:CAMPEP_0194525282 /NCGR_PEP_ID=MMETSP0253-20130528/60706_1 /TAXON_ID=2966 /ORGANISM="Noctiluca scintillans" /LENGTH=136 /DNA_ID=CAMNT_0039369993 /DNA_START=43 /DNA_END=453 /DNA_ORIENTATION=+
MELLGRMRLGCCCTDNMQEGYTVVAEDPQSDEHDALPVGLPFRQSNPQEGEYMITLFKEAGTLFGAKVVQSTKSCDIVVKRITKGLIQDWNDAHPERSVKIGDKLVSVNGARGPTSYVLMEKLKSDGKLELIFQSS